MHQNRPVLLFDKSHCMVDQGLVKTLVGEEEYDKSLSVQVVDPEGRSRTWELIILPRGPHGEFQWTSSKRTRDMIHRIALCDSGNLSPLFIDGEGMVWKNVPNRPWAERILTNIGRIITKACETPYLIAVKNRLYYVDTKAIEGMKEYVTR
jgi:hypothetical protein